MAKRTKIMIGIISTILIVFAYLILDVRIGVPESHIEKDARAGHQIDDNWLVVKETKGRLHAMLFYPPNLEGAAFVSIYRNHPGLYFGYFFVSGGTGPSIDFDYELHRDTVDGFACYFSLNGERACKVEYDLSSEKQTIELDSEKPYVFILPPDAENVIIYDAAGNVVENPYNK